MEEGGRAADPGRRLPLLPGRCWWLPAITPPPPAPANAPGPTGDPLMGDPGDPGFPPGDPGPRRCMFCCRLVPPTTRTIPSCQKVASSADWARGSGPWPGIMSKVARSGMSNSNASRFSFLGAWEWVSGWEEGQDKGRTSGVTAAAGGHSRWPEGVGHSGSIAQWSVVCMHSLLEPILSLTPITRALDAY
jgi:hypothetical protein